jgi:FixJ family two-component response regulator
MFLSGFLLATINEENEEWIMRSAAVTEIPGVDPISLAHFFGHEFESQPRSHNTRIVFVVEEDDTVRESLELLISSKGWQPVTFASAEELLARPRALVPNCLLLGVSLPGFNALQLQRRVAIERTEMPIIFITDFCDVRIAVQAMKAGAVEFLTKPFSDDMLLTAIAQGLERSRMALNHQAEIRTLGERYGSLTQRERQVMALVVSGLLNKQVGGELGISEITVKAHRGQVMQKMKANSLPDLVRMAASLRLGRDQWAFTSLDCPEPFPIHSWDSGARRAS